MQGVSTVKTTRRILFFFERWLFYTRTVIVCEPGDPKFWRKRWTQVASTGETMYCSRAKSRDGQLKLIVWRRK